MLCDRSKTLEPPSVSTASRHSNLSEGASKVVCRKCGNPVSSDEATCPNCGAELAPSTDSLEDKSEGLRKMSRELKAIDAESQTHTPGDIVADRFDIEEYVGDGRFGEVYRAHDQLVETAVALKLFDRDLIRTPPERESFIRATESARSMTQENVVRVHDSGVAGEQPWVSMQYLEGLTLSKVLEMREDKGERFTLEEVEPIVGQITLALQHIGREHPVGFLNPDDIFILPDLVKITDGYLWGAFPPDIVLERAGDSPYLAPECHEAPERDVDLRCDVYSMGLIVGKMLFGPEYEPGAVECDASEDEAVDELCSRATAESPEERYPSVEALSEDFVTLVDTGQLLDSTASMNASIPAITPDEADDRAGPDEQTAVVPRDEAPIPDPPDDEPDASPPPPAEGPVDEMPGQPSPTEEPTREGSSSIPDQAPPTEEHEREEADPIPEQAPATEEYERDGSPPLPEDEVATEEYARDDEEQSPEFNPEVFPDQEGGQEDISLPDPDFDAPDEPSSQTPVEGEAPPDEPGADDPGDNSEGSELDDASMPEEPSGEPTTSTDRRRATPETAAEATPTDRPPNASPSQRDDSSSSNAKIIAAGLVFVVLTLVAGLASFISGEGDEGQDKTIAIEETSVDASASDADDAGARDEVDDKGPSPEWVTALSTSRAHRADAVKAARGEAETRAEELEEDQEDQDDQADGDRRASATGSSGNRGTGAAARRGSQGGRAATEEKTDCPDDMVLVERDSGDNYCIDQFEHPGQGRQPMVQATWFQAQSTCDEEGKRLCKLAEWKRACGFQTYPYGSEWNAKKCNTQNEMGFARELAPTGQFDTCRSWTGAYDMTGNVHEWVKEQKIAGGGFDSGPDVASCDYASPKEPGSSARTIGFRCCADPE